MCVARTGVFLERDFISKGISDTPKEEHEREKQLVMEGKYAQVEQHLCRSSEICHQPERYKYHITNQDDVLLMDQCEHVSYQEIVVGLE